MQVVNAMCEVSIPAAHPMIVANRSAGAEIKLTNAGFEQSIVSNKIRCCAISGQKWVQPKK